jgi:hypothetical protein
LTLRQFRASPVGLLCGSMRKAKRRRWLPLLDLTMSGVGHPRRFGQVGRISAIAPIATKMVRRHI